MASIGEELNRERMRQGVTLKDIESVLHIRAAYLEAIEADNFTIIPGDVYVKGFIRNYANFLGLDGQKFVDRYKEIIGEDPVILKVRSHTTSKKKKEEKTERKNINHAKEERLTYEGRRKQREKTVVKEKFAVAIIVILMVIFFVWLFIF